MLEAEVAALRGEPLPASPDGPAAVVPLVAPPLPSAAPRRVRAPAAFRELCEGPASFPLEVAGNRHYVTVTLRGPKAAGRFRFQVDTGGSTPGLTLLQSVADNLGFERGRGAEALPRTIAIGERELSLPDNTQWALLDDLSPQSRARPDSWYATRRNFAVGQIGAGFLSRYLVCIDPARGRLGLASPVELEIEPADRDAIPILVEPAGANRALYPFVHVLLQAGGRFSGGYGMLLDTGATTSMLEVPALDYQAKANPSWPRFEGAAGDADMLGSTPAETVLRAEQLVITSPGLERWRKAPPSPEEWEQFPKLRPEIAAGTSLLVERPKGAFRQMFGEVGYAGGPHGALANDVLGSFRILLDYRGARLWLDPVEHAIPASSATTRIGLTLAFGADGCPVIRRVTDTNAAETRAKLRVGDVLRSVDGRDACTRWHHEIAADLAGSVSERKTIVVRRGGQSLSFTLPVVDLLASAASRAQADKARPPAPPARPVPAKPIKRPTDGLFDDLTPSGKPTPPKTRPDDKLFERGGAPAAPAKATKPTGSSKAPPPTKGDALFDDDRPAPPRPPVGKSAAPPPSATPPTR